MNTSFMSFEDFVGHAMDGDTGGARRRPFSYQQHLAARPEGLPQVLQVPTGSGKTAAAVLPWLWRLTAAADPATRSATPHRLVYVLPMRSLVEQTRTKTAQWLGNLSSVVEAVKPVQLHVLMGGEERDDFAWQLHPEAPAILIGTQDMVLSRALMRGYAESRSRWPVTFGLLHSGTQWVFDETQLMGPALGTSAQLQGLRDALGTAAPTASMWMSATLDEKRLHTPDHDNALDVVKLTEADRTGALAVRLSGTRRVRRVHLPTEQAAYARTLAQRLLEAHEPGTRTIAVLNTVARATLVYKELGELAPAAETLLAHSRFRPRERGLLSERVAEEPPEAGRIIVCTQVLEAGVDVTSSILFSETAPWSSFVQRCGRCNREGEVPGDGTVLWSPPPKGSAPPYKAEELAATEAELKDLEGVPVTAEQLSARTVRQHEPLYAQLRRRDLVQLFDTAPDLTGADIDVGPWIRDGGDSTAFVAWRDLRGRAPDGDATFPRHGELCPAPIGEVAKMVTAKKPRKVWVKDRLVRGWRAALRADVVPGAVLLLDAREGGYSLTLGWAPGNKQPVPSVEQPATGTDDDLGGDPRSFGTGKPVALSTHLADVDEAIGHTVTALGGRCSGMAPELLTAARLAGRYHDLGKCHRVFQDTLREALLSEFDAGVLLAKSDGTSGRHSVPYFRHELVSALMLLHPECTLLDDIVERDLVAYLAAAHHGKARVTVRSVKDESSSTPPKLMGVAEGDQTPPVATPDGETVPALRLSLDLFAFGQAPDGRETWTQRVLRLRDREDLGPFRLAFLEALVRTSDWRASRVDEPREAA